jgi:prevent-host-death family protein
MREIDEGKVEADPNVARCVQGSYANDEAIMTTVSIEEAKAKLAELIALLQAGDEVVITSDSFPVARLVAAAKSGGKPRHPGTLKGTVTYMASDFDAPLPEFQEYSP